MIATKKTRRGLGAEHPAEYTAWQNMKYRCHPERKPVRGWEHYGGKGVKVCKRWQHDFEAFLKDMGPRPSPEHSIGRKDNDGNYTPQNCFWATRDEQADNRSCTQHHTFDGETKTRTDWIKWFQARSKFPAYLIRNRLLLGWNKKEILEKPVGWKHPRKLVDGKTIDEWAQIAGITRQALAGRLEGGWTLQEAMAMPLAKRGYKWRIRNDVKWKVLHEGKWLSATHVERLTGMDRACVLARIKGKGCRTLEEVLSVVDGRKLRYSGKKGLTNFPSKP